MILPSEVISMVRRSCRPFLAIALGVWTLVSIARADDASEARMRKDITVLASDAFEGRGVTTAGIDRAADYIAEAFRGAGLKGAGKDGSYFQPFTIPGATLESPNTLSLTGPRGQEIAFRLGSDFEPLGMSHSGKVDAPLVFVGYGITSSNKELPYDDYAGVDATDKVVIVLRDAPRPDNKYLLFDGMR